MNPRILRLTFTLPFLLGVFARAFPQSDHSSVLKANRPGISESPGLVIPGALQIETGSTIRKNKEGNTKITNYIFNTLSLRYGINEKFELRFKSDYVGTKETTGTDKTLKNGWAPFSFGMSFQLMDQKGFIPEIFFIPNIRFRTGSSPFKAPYTSGDMTLAMGHELNKVFYLTYHAGVSWDGASPEAIFSYMLCLDVALNDNTSIFIESYNYFVENRGTSCNGDAGIYYRLTPAIQVDVSAGTGLNRKADDFFVDGGFTIRLIK